MKPRRAAHAKIRLDDLLVERHLVPDRSTAERFVMAGQVRVNGQVISLASSPVAQDSAITIDRGPRFVSRGGEKLVAALEAFGVHVQGRVCADVGAATGGFSDCLLQHGAARVIAIDVGEGILDWKLRQDNRVLVMEGVNARDLVHLPEPASLVVIDASFISLKTLLPVVSGWAPNEIIALIKPQFEAERQESARGKGVIRNAEIHRAVLADVLGAAIQGGWQVAGLIRSPLQGPKGNIEFLAWLKKARLSPPEEISLADWIKRVLL
jgi:23S rRNA (cytidine1920-2'-O)/16S rRNA (cytidine1409-2'-O)-methyltransferase